MNQNASILVIDDNASVRKSLRLLFEAAGFVCFESEDGAQGVQHAVQLKPDLIVLDFSMPGMNGLEAAPLLKKSLPQTPIILYSMYSSQILAHLVTSDGISAFISKEDGLKQLLITARSLLKHQSA